jgi:hypothetical protein
MFRPPDSVLIDTLLPVQMISPPDCRTARRMKSMAARFSAASSGTERSSKMSVLAAGLTLGLPAGHRGPRNLSQGFQTSRIVTVNSVGELTRSTRA